MGFPLLTYKTGRIILSIEEYSTKDTKYSLLGSKIICWFWEWAA